MTDIKKWESFIKALKEERRLATIGYVSDEEIAKIEVLESVIRAAESAIEI